MLSPYFLRKGYKDLEIKNKDKQRIIKNIERILSEIFSDKYEAKITIKFCNNN